MKRPLHKRIGNSVKNAHRRVTKYLFERDTLFATAWVFIFIWVLGSIPLNLYVLNPIKLGLKDFDYTDIAYAELKKGENSKIDSRVILLNIGDADREGLAYLLSAASGYQPKVIGFDVVFDGPKDPGKDSLLAAAISKTPNLVLASKFIPGKGEAESEYLSNYFISSATATEGYANWFHDEWSSIRLWNPFFREIKGQGSTERKSFASAVLEKYDTGIYEKLIKRHKHAEIINYSRRASQYQILVANDILTGRVDSSVLKGKILLLGYVNTDPNQVEDKFFTPMNKKFAGKSIPDMNGLLIHANILSMALTNNYIKKLPSWINWVITLLICWLHMSFFIHYYLENHIWFHLAAKIAQVLSAILFVYLGIYLFDRFNVKIDMKMPLVVIIMAVDVIYFYEAWATWMHQKFKYRTVFKPHLHS